MSRPSSSPFNRVGFASIRLRGATAPKTPSWLTGLAGLIPASVNIRTLTVVLTGNCYFHSVDCWPARSPLIVKLSAILPCAGRRRSTILETRIVLTSQAESIRLFERNLGGISSCCKTLGAEHYQSRFSPVKLTESAAIQWRDLTVSELLLSSAVLLCRNTGLKTAK